MRKFMRKIGLLLIAVMMILPAMAQVSFGVRAGGAYSSLIQKVEDTYAVSYTHLTLPTNSLV